MRFILFFLFSFGMNYCSSTFRDLVKKSNEFQHTIKAFPTRDNRIISIANENKELQKQIEEHAKGVSILVHQKVYHEIIPHFLTFKRTYGSRKEKKLYRSMSTKEFVQRLILKRPLVFMGSEDWTVDRKGCCRGSVHEDWEEIEKDGDSSCFDLKEYLSYDEISISALLAVSTPTFFINSGDRTNRGIRSPNSNYEKFGIYIAAVGARFEVPKQMEDLFIIKKKLNSNEGETSNENDKPLQKEWMTIYNDLDNRYKHLGQERYVNLSWSKKIFDMYAFRSRMRITFETILGDAKHRASEYHKQVYLRIVGLGLGVWAVDQEIQTVAYIDELLDVIHDMGGVSVVELMYIDPSKSYPSQITTNEGNDVRILFTRNSPASPLPAEYKDHLLVATYAWDGNSFPGNEYWQNSLSASGDPAAACCSTIPELQNPYINTKMMNNIRIISA